MPKLSSPHYELQAHYPIIIVGSGYGGAIMASRLARANQEVCLLERGKEFQVGEYPNTALSTLENLQIDGLANYHGSRLGLYHIYYGKEMSVFVGCGLGGTSLVNANVSLRAEPHVFDDPCWPKEIQNDLQTKINIAYQDAEAMLKPTPYPDNFPKLHKLEALHESAQVLNEPFYRPPINVNFAVEGENHVGVLQHPCQLCGDCVSGCNYAAKNTLIMNYLPDAKNHGAAIFTQMDVQFVERRNDGRWIVYYHDLSLTGEEAQQQLRFIITDLLIISGGALGSTEILLRSKANGLKISDQVGQHFTGNGDVLAFGYNMQQSIYGVGYGAESPQGKTPIGPCITGIIDMRNRPQLNEGMVIEEGVIPGGMATFLPQVFALSAKFFGVTHVPPASPAEAELDVIRYAGAMNHTQTFLVMSHDDGKGKLILDNDHVRVSWPGVGAAPHFAKVNEVLQTATDALGGTFIPNPMWSKATEHTLVTVHPLGGCIMADDAAKGVVNHKGQVFSNQSGTACYDNLYVADGAIIPRSLGVNPLLTISALTERACALMTAERNWKINYALPSAPQKTPETTEIGLLFTETMRGRLSTTQLADYDSAYSDNASSPFEFTLTIVSENLVKMLSEETHSAKIVGEVRIPIFSKLPLVVEQGEFQLFITEQKAVGVRKMIYQMTLSSVEGKRYQFEGYKLIHNDPGIDIWQDTTTLFVNIYELKETTPRLCAKGILKILIPDFIQQLTTIRVLNTSDPKEIFSAKAKFGSFFAGVLYQTYGGIFAKTVFFNPESAPREKRKLQVSLPEVHLVTTADKQQIRLTRYKGGNKGPVILSHGLGVSSLIFAIDTIGPNLLEYLFAQDYDVWLLDYRASIDLPIANNAFSADDIALYDYPAAVSKVLEVTQAKDVQMVAHCFGATTLCMAMLAGLKGVRSILFSQVAAHMVVPFEAKLKAGLHLPSVLNKLGIPTLTAYAAKNENWQEALFDLSLKFAKVDKEEQCDNPVCRRITFLYGPLYEHDQLNQATHDALHEMFGVANIKSFEQLALFVRKGHIVNFAGKEDYLPHLDRLALPITFIHGEENHCFLPESTAITYNLLKETNGSAFYKRFIIPNYGHIDCIFGKNAVHDVYPYILQHLEMHATQIAKEPLIES